MSRTERLDALQRRRPGLGFPIAVVYKLFDDQGGYLAALIAHYAFLSLFPLLLLLTTVLGFVLHGHPEVQQQVVSSALSQFPVIGNQLRTDTTSLKGSGLGLGVGIAGTVYGTLGMAQAVQNALDKIWAVPRQQRPNPFKSRLRSLLLLGVLGLGVLFTTALSGVTTSSSALGAVLGPWTRVGATLLSVAVNIWIFLLAFKLLTARRVSWRQIRLGAITAAVGWQLLQTLGTYYLSHKLKGSTQVYGLFGLVLGLLAWLYLEAFVIVIAAEVNVVRVERLYPRALLTPFSDDVDLTHSDMRAYTSYAKTEQYKSFQQVDVAFQEQPDVAGAPLPPPTVVQADIAPQEPDPDAPAG